MFNALLPSICIYFHLVVKYLLHSIMSHILGLISKTLISCTSHQLHWNVWVLSTAENQVSPPFWSHTNNIKEVAGKEVFFPSIYNVFLPCMYFWYPPEVFQNFWTWHKSIHVYEKSQDTLIAGRLKASIPAAKYMCIVCLPADTQVQYNHGVLHGLCAYEEMPIHWNKNIWLACISYNRTQTVMAIYHCPSSQIFPEFLAHVRSRIYSRWRINKGLGPEGSLLPARLEFCRPWGAVSKTVMNV